MSDAAVPLDGPDEVELPVDPARLTDLRRARRQRRVAEIHWIDALYRVYVAAIVGVVVVIVIAGAVGDAPLNADQVDDLRAGGPAVIGLVAALAVAVGLRSGSQGGPLAVEAADVRHVLLAPVERAAALRGPAIRQVRTALFGSVLLGAAVGHFAHRRLPEPDVQWIAAGAVAAATVVALSLGAALVASGLRAPRWVATAVGVVLVAWSGADVAGRAMGTSVPPSPGRSVGWVTLAPLDPHPVALAPVLVAVVLVAVGLIRVGGVSVEQAERRTALVGQIRFAATLQDVRTVLVLRRQLAADSPRTRAWIDVSRLAGRVRPVGLRAWQGLLRFPASRVGRVVLLAVLAGAALRVAWSGTAPVIVVAGLAMWVLGLDLVEPLAQEVDHPSRRELYPHPEGGLYVTLLTPSLVVAGLLGVGAGSVAAAPGAGAVPWAAALVTGLAVALSGVAGAVLNTVSGEPSHKSDLALIAPEVAGMKVVLKTVFPVVVAVTGALPLLIVRANLDAGRSMLDGSTAAWAAVLGLVTLVIGWVHRRAEILDWWQEAMDANTALRAGTDGDAEDGDAEDDEDDEADDEDEDPGDDPDDEEDTHR